ncbi:MAG: leucyl/phenylalanyl-tRNA--protein transferase [Gammaproteobacteria bacterium]|nr:leucyl/phenylalanyl-tRNA--protein transferase [Gammaproteobacteria bacterium]NNM13272.1 leucyl/phenylalanyl-tRNA--protein transferase [Gammaproteobacteria bacterium]
MTSIHWLPENSSPDSFPELREALTDPDGLLAAGGDLSIERLLYAYEHGIFPWYSADQPILWWSPDPRMVLYPDKVHIPKRLKRFLKKHPYELRFDRAFRQVIEACAQPRYPGDGTWIMPEMINAYCELHKNGHAHCLEIWRTDKEQEKLVGGIYGIAIGQVFFGESMFSLEDNASKLAFISLAKHLEHWGYQLLDAQVESDHLRTLGCELIPRDAFSVILDSACPVTMSHDWELIPEILVT